MGIGYPCMWPYGSKTMQSSSYKTRIQGVTKPRQGACEGCMATAVQSSMRLFASRSTRCFFNGWKVCLWHYTQQIMSLLSPTAITLSATKPAGNGFLLLSVEVMAHYFLSSFCLDTTGFFVWAAPPPRWLAVLLPSSWSPLMSLSPTNDVTQGQNYNLKR